MKTSSLLYDPVALRNQYEDEQHASRDKLRKIIADAKAKAAVAAAEAAEPPTLTERLMDDASAVPIKQKRGRFHKERGFVFNQDDRNRIRYFQASYQVATCVHLSIEARGLYLWLEGRMSNINPAHDVCEMILSLEEIAKGCAVSVTTAKKYMQELLDVKAVHETPRGHNMPVLYTLPLKRDRLRKLAERVGVESTP